ncbi:MAG: hypothetical protein RLZZ300_2417, partial [Pseudomonadota bacterium]
ASQFLAVELCIIEVVYVETESRTVGFCAHLASTQVPGVAFVVAFAAGLVFCGLAMVSNPFPENHRATPFLP